MSTTLENTTLDDEASCIRIIPMPLKLEPLSTTKCLSIKHCYITQQPIVIRPYSISA
jgi:hypothetical protein